jgi:hypothetical protein
VILVSMSSAKSVMSGRIWRGWNIGWSRRVCRKMIRKNVEGRKFEA